MPSVLPSSTKITSQPRPPLLRRRREPGNQRLYAAFLVEARDNQGDGRRAEHVSTRRGGSTRQGWS